MMYQQSLFAEGPERRMLAFPTEGPDDKIRINPGDVPQIHRAIRAGMHLPERHAFALELEGTFAPFPGALLSEPEKRLQVPSHLLGDQFHDPDPHERRRIALVGQQWAGPVPDEEGILRSLPRAIRPPAPMALDTRARIGSTDEPLVHPPNPRRRREALLNSRTRFRSAPKSMLNGKLPLKKLVANGEEVLDTPLSGLDTELLDAHILVALAGIEVIDKALPALVSPPGERIHDPSVKLGVVRITHGSGKPAHVTRDGFGILRGPEFNALSRCRSGNGPGRLLRRRRLTRNTRECPDEKKPCREEFQRQQRVGRLSPQP
jgi:hypothetical protein